MTSPRVLLAVVLGVLVLGAAVYAYGRSASCPPPDWWFALFRQSGTYRCAG